VPVTTLNAAKAYKNLQGTELDALIERMIPGVQALMETAMQRRIDSAERTETYHGTGGRAMLLRQWPVTAVAEVLVDGVPVPPGSHTAPGWRLAGRTLVLNGSRFTAGWENVQVRYTAGWTVVPGDLELAAHESLFMSIERRNHLDVSSKALAGETVAYITAALTPAAQATVDRYKSVAPV